MTKQALSILYFCFFVFTHSLMAQILQYENQIIKQIEIISHPPSQSSVDSNAVLSRIKTKADGFFSQQEFDEDLKTLSQDFDRIDPIIESSDQKVYITLNIWPKPTIHSIQYKGHTIISMKRLQKELAIHPGSVFDRKAFNTAFHKLKAYYVRKGFFEAKIDYQIELNSETNEVDIFIDIDEGRSGKIEEIVFVNFSDCERDDILGQMITKKYNIFLSWLTDEGIYNEEMIQQDQLIITNYLQNEGYADAEVTITAVESSTNRINIFVNLNRGERYFFNSIWFEGNKTICDEELDKLFTVRPGDHFSIDAVRKTVELITNAYGKLGYIDAVVNFDPEILDGQYLYDVKFTIDEGGQFRVGMIKVFGNITTKSSVILHETPLVPGEIFNLIKLKVTERRLQNIGYFKNVNVYTVKSSEASYLGDNYRDVYIEVEETSTGQFSAFFGYSNVDELFGGFSVTENNFNQAGIWEMWKKGPGSLRGGGENANFTAKIGQKSTSYDLSWTKPHFMDSKWAVGVDLSKASARYISEEYDLDTVMINLRGQRKINNFVSTGVHYRLKNGVVKLHNMHHEEKEHPHGTHELRKEAHLHGLISAVGTSLTYDSTDRPLKATEGFRSKLFLEFAGVGGDHSFINAAYVNSYYYPIGSRLTIKYRADFRFLQPLGNTHYATTPLDERIFLGGDNNVRGYRPYRLGPQYYHTHIPRGGLSMQLYSVEMSRRLFGEWDLFAFMDAGHLSKETWEFGRLSVSAGYGLRFKLPVASIPPLTIGMGYPLNPRNRSEVQKFFISFGASF